MTSIDPAVEARFAQILTGTRAKAADITDRVESTSRRLAEESQRMREANERLCKELDERSAAKAAAKDDPAAKNEWLKRNTAQDATYQFGDEPEPAPEVTERTQPPATQGRGRHSLREDFDDDDFSNNSWLG